MKPSCFHAVVPRLNLPQSDTDPLQNLLDFGEQVSECAREMTEHGPPEPTSEQERECEEVRLQFGDRLDQAGDAVVRENYAPRATVDVVQTRVQAHLVACADVLTFAPRTARCRHICISDFQDLLLIMTFILFRLQFPTIGAMMHEGICNSPSPT